eukprot:gene6998-8344_t
MRSTSGTRILKEPTVETDDTTNTTIMLNRALTVLFCEVRWTGPGVFFAEMKVRGAGALVLEIAGLPTQIMRQLLHKSQHSSDNFLLSDRAETINLIRRSFEAATGGNGGWTRVLEAELVQLGLPELAVPVREGLCAAAGVVTREFLKELDDELQQRLVTQPEGHVALDVDMMEPEEAAQNAPVGQFNGDALDADALDSTPLPAQHTEPVMELKRRRKAGAEDADASATGIVALGNIVEGQGMKGHGGRYYCGKATFEASPSAGCRSGERQATPAPTRAALTLAQLKRVHVASKKAELTITQRIRGLLDDPPGAHDAMTLFSCSCKVDPLEPGPASQRRPAKGGDESLCVHALGLPRALLCDAQLNEHMVDLSQEDCGFLGAPAPPGPPYGLFGTPAPPAEQARQQLVDRLLTGNVSLFLLDAASGLRRAVDAARGALGMPSMAHHLLSGSVMPSAMQQLLNEAYGKPAEGTGKEAALAAALGLAIRAGALQGDHLERADWAQGTHGVPVGAPLPPGESLCAAARPCSEGGASGLECHVGGRPASLFAPEMLVLLAAACGSTVDRHVADANVMEEGLAALPPSVAASALLHLCLVHGHWDRHRALLEQAVARINEVAGGSGRRRIGAKQGGGVGDSAPAQNGHEAEGGDSGGTGRETRLGRKLRSNPHGKRQRGEAEPVVEDRPKVAGCGGAAQGGPRLCSGVWGLDVLWGGGAMVHSLHYPRTGLVALARLYNIVSGGASDAAAAADASDAAAASDAADAANDKGGDDASGDDDRNASGGALGGKSERKPVPAPGATTAPGDAAVAGFARMRLTVTMPLVYLPAQKCVAARVVDEDERSGGRPVSFSGLQGEGVREWVRENAQRQTLRGGGYKSRSSPPASAPPVEAGQAAEAGTTRGTYLVTLGVKDALSGELSLQGGCTPLAGAAEDALWSDALRASAPADTGAEGSAILRCMAGCPDASHSHLAPCRHQLAVLRAVSCQQVWGREMTEVEREEEALVGSAGDGGAAVPSVADGARLHWALAQLPSVKDALDRDARENGGQVLLQRLVERLGSGGVGGDGPAALGPAGGARGEAMRPFLDVGRYVAGLSEQLQAAGEFRCWRHVWALERPEHECKCKDIVCCYCGGRATTFDEDEYEDVDCKYCDGTGWDDWEAREEGPEGGCCKKCCGRFDEDSRPSFHPDVPRPYWSLRARDASMRRRPPPAPPLPTWVRPTAAAAPGLLRAAWAALCSGAGFAQPAAVWCAPWLKLVDTVLSGLQRELTTTRKMLLRMNADRKLDFLLAATPANLREETEELCLSSLRLLAESVVPMLYGVCPVPTVDAAEGREVDGLLKAARETMQRAMEEIAAAPALAGEVGAVKVGFREENLRPLIGMEASQVVSNLSVGYCIHDRDDVAVTNVVGEVLGEWAARLERCGVPWTHKFGVRVERCVFHCQPSTLPPGLFSDLLRPPPPGACPEELRERIMAWTARRLCGALDTIIELYDLEKESRERVAKLQQHAQLYLKALLDALQRFSLAIDPPRTRGSSMGWRELRSGRTPGLQQPLTAAACDAAAAALYDPTQFVRSEDIASVVALARRAAGLPCGGGLRRVIESILKVVAQTWTTPRGAGLLPTKPVYRDDIKREIYLELESQLRKLVVDVAQLNGGASGEVEALAASGLLGQVPKSIAECCAVGLRDKAGLPRAALEVLAAGSSWPLDVAPGDSPADWAAVADALLEAAAAGGSDECVPRALHRLGEHLGRSGGAEWTFAMLPMLLHVLHAALCALPSMADALVSGDGGAQAADAGLPPDRGASSSDRRAARFRAAVEAIVDPARPIIKKWHLQLLQTGRAPPEVHAEATHSQSLAVQKRATLLAITLERLAATYMLQDARCAVAYLAAVAVQSTGAERAGDATEVFARSLSAALAEPSPSSRAEAVNATLRALCAALRVTAPEATVDTALLSRLAADPVVGSCAPLARAVASLEVVWRQAVDANAQWQEPWSAAKSEVLRAPEGPLERLRLCADQYSLQRPLQHFLADELAAGLKREKTPGQVANMVRILVTQHLSGGLPGGEEELSERRLLPLEAPQLRPQDFPEN